MHSPITASLEEHRFGVFQNSLKKPKYKLVLVCFGSVLVLCVTQMYIGLLSRCVSFLNTLLFALSYLLFLLYSDFHVFPQALHAIIADLKC